MEGVIFIRTLTQEQEEILENFKVQKNITANTKAVQRIITEFDKLSQGESRMREEIRELKEDKWKLEEELDDYREFFKMFSKLQSK